MAQEGLIPADIDTFLRAHIESIDHVEILRILGDSPQRDWSIGDLAKECQISVATATACAQTLENHGLIKTQMIDGQAQCKFGPRSPEIEQQLSRVLQFYKERPVTLIKRIYALTSDRLKAFADAFQFRKDI